jgi:hypothetical protein
LLYRSDHDYTIPRLITAPRMMITDNRLFMGIMRLSRSHGARLSDSATIKVAT